MSSVGNYNCRSSVDIAETIYGEHEKHVALLCRLVDGSYYLVDSAYPDASGPIPPNLLMVQEIELGLRSNIVYERSLPGTRFHRKVRVLKFDNALLSWTFGNLACLLCGLGDAMRKGRDNTGAMEKYEESIACCKKALERNPRKAAVWYILGYAYGCIGDVYQDMGEGDKIIEMYKYEIEIYTKAARINPQYIDAINSLGFAYSKLGRIYSNKNIRDQAAEMYKLAMKAYREALEKNVGFVLAWSNLGSLFEVLGMKDKADLSFECAIKTEKGDEISKEDLSRIF